MERVTREAMLYTTSTVQSFAVHHRPALCTTDPRCARCAEDLQTLSIPRIFNKGDLHVLDVHVIPIIGGSHGHRV